MTTGSGGDRRVVTVAHFQVFERGAVGGNPCPIVTEAADLSAADMQQLAAQLGEESGFVSYDDDGCLRFRFFMPLREVPMCVHATVAATTALVLNGRLSSGEELVVRTASGQCRVSCDGEAPPRVTVEQQPPRFGDPLDVAGTVEQALGLEPGSVDGEQPVRSVSVSDPKLIVPLHHAHDVHRARPDFELLSKLCQDLETTGAYVFAPHPDGGAGHFVARQFPVGGGVREDAATGVAAGALAAHVADRSRAAPRTWIAVEIDQGDAMGRPCRLHAAAYTDEGEVRRTTVTGSATLKGEERLDLNAAGGGGR